MAAESPRTRRTPASPTADEWFTEGVNALAEANGFDFALPEGCAFCPREITVEEGFPEFTLRLTIGVLVPYDRLRAARTAAQHSKSDDESRALLREHGRLGE